MADNASKTKQASTYKGYNNIIAVRIRELMKSSGTTQQELAEKTGCSRQAIAQYADGSNAPNIDKLVSIAKYFDVSLDYLVGLSNAQTADKDIQYICDYTGLAKKSVEELHIIEKLSKGLIKNDEFIDDKEYKEFLEQEQVHSKEFLHYISEFILDISLHQIALNIHEYFYITEEIEEINQDNTMLNAELYSKKATCLDEQAFALFKISKYMQEMVQNLYKKERNSNGNNRKA